MFEIVQEIINNAVAETVEENSDSEWAQCTQSVFQSIALIIDNSNIRASGDLRVSQKARVALACAQRTDFDVNLRTQIENKIVERVGELFREQKVPLQPQVIRARVNPALERAAKECKMDESQGIAVAPTIRFQGVTLTVGCLQEKFDRLAEECRAAIRSGQDRNNACMQVADCLSKRGNIDIIVDFNYSDACKTPDQLAVQLTADAIAANSARTPLPDTTENKTKTEWQTWLLPALAGLLVFVLLLVVVVRAARKRKEPSVAYSYQTPYTYVN